MESNEQPIWALADRPVLNCQYLSTDFEQPRHSVSVDQSITNEEVFFTELKSINNACNTAGIKQEGNSIGGLLHSVKLG